MSRRQNKYQSSVVNEGDILFPHFPLFGSYRFVFAGVMYVFTLLPYLCGYYLENASSESIVDRNSCGNLLSDVMSALLNCSSICAADDNVSKFRL
jgi:hypothetical protein